MTTDRSESTVKSLETTLGIVQFLHRRGKATIEEVSEAVGSSTSTVHRHLVTLCDWGYVVAEDHEYRLSLLFLTHGGEVRDRIFASEMVKRKVQQLGEKTDERAQFMVEENGERVYVYTHSGPSGVKTDSAVGKRGPLHVSAAGKAILASLPDDRTEEILDGIEFDAQPDRAIASREELETELSTITEQGYAINDEESTEGLRAVGVPIRFEDGSVYGAISVSGPVHRLRGDYFHEELPDLLLGTANEIELNLKYP